MKYSKARIPVDETVTLGHTCIGRVKELPRGFLCFDAVGNRLTLEKTVQDARKALHSRHQVAVVVATVGATS